MDWETISVLLDELHAALGDASIELDSTLQAIATEVTRVFNSKDELQEDDYTEQLRRLCVLLFHSDDDLDAISFIRKSLASGGSSRSPVAKAREQLLYIIANSIPELQATFIPYADLIRAVCMSVVKLDSASDSAKAAFAPFISLIQSNLFSSDQLHIEETFNTIIDALRSTSSVYHKQNGPKGAACTFLGVLVASFPASFEANQVYDEVYVRLMALLRNIWHGNVETLDSVLSEKFAESVLEDEDETATAAATKASGSKAASVQTAQPAVIAGCISGLWLLLRTFPEILSAANKKKFVSAAYPAVELYTYVLRGAAYAITSKSGRISLDIPESCLSFVAEHMGYMASSLMPHAKPVFNLFHQLCHMKGRGRLKSLARSALIAFVQEVTTALKAPGCKVDGKGFLHWLASEKLMYMVAGVPSFGDVTAMPYLAYVPTYDILLGIECLGACAGGFRIFLKPETSLQFLSVVLDNVTNRIRDADTLPNITASGSSPPSAAESAADAGDGEDEDDDAPMREASTSFARRQTLQGIRSKALLVAAGLRTCSYLLNSIAPEAILPLNMSQMSSLATYLLGSYHKLTGTATTARNDVFHAIVAFCVVCHILENKAFGVTSRAFDDIVKALVHATLSQDLSNTETERYHPLNGLPETRLLFEFAPLWLQLCQFRGNRMMSLVRSLVAAGSVDPTTASADVDTDTKVDAIVNTFRLRFWRTARHELRSRLESLDLAFSAAPEVMEAVGVDVSHEGTDGQQTTSISGSDVSMLFSMFPDYAESSQAITSGAPDTASSDEHTDGKNKVTVSQPVDHVQLSSMLDLMRFLGLSLQVLPTDAGTPAWVRSMASAALRLLQRYPHNSLPFVLLGQLALTFGAAVDLSTVQVTPTATLADILTKAAATYISRLASFANDQLFHLGVFVCLLPDALLRKSSDKALQLVKAFISNGLRDIKSAYLGVEALGKLLNNGITSVADVAAIVPNLSTLLSAAQVDSSSKDDAANSDPASNEDENAQVSTTALISNTVTESYSSSVASLRSKPKIFTLAAVLRGDNDTNLTAASLRDVVYPSDYGWSLLQLLDVDVSIEMLRRRVTDLIGSLDADTIVDAGKANMEALHAQTAWAKIAQGFTRLVIPVSLLPSHTRSDLPLDVLLPEVVKLATTSPDRRIKVSASELFHSCCTLAIGNFYQDLTKQIMTARQVRGGQAAPAPAAGSAYYETLVLCFPHMVQLALDRDQVTQQMFRVLTEQCIRLLSAHPKQQESFALYDCLWDNAVTDDAARRGRAIALLGLYFEWCVKHATTGILERESLARRMVEKLFSECRHARESNRLAAALFFAKIYRTFRENHDLASTYVLALIDHFLINLRLSEFSAVHSIDEELLSVKAAATALDQCKRIVNANIDVLRMPTGERPAVSPLTISELLGYLYSHLLDEGKQTRRRVYAFLESLLPPVFNKNNDFHGAVVAWINAVSTDKHFMRHGLARYVNEHDTKRIVDSGVSGLVEQVVGSLRDAAMGDNLDFPKASAGLHCLSWLLDHHVIPANDILPSASSAETTTGKAVAGRKRSRHTAEETTGGGSEVWQALNRISEELIIQQDVSDPQFPIYEAAGRQLAVFVAAFVAALEPEQVRQLVTDGTVNVALKAVLRSYITALSSGSAPMLTDASAMSLYGKTIEGLLHKLSKSGAAEIAQCVVEVSTVVFGDLLGVEDVSDKLLAATPSAVATTNFLDMLHNAHLLDEYLRCLSDSDSKSHKRSRGAVARKGSRHLHDGVVSVDSAENLASQLFEVMLTKLGSGNIVAEACGNPLSHVLRWGLKWTYDDGARRGLAALLGVESETSTTLTREIYSKHRADIIAHMLKIDTFVAPAASSSATLSLASFPVMKTMASALKVSQSSTTAVEVIGDMIAALTSSSSTAAEGVRISRKVFVVALLFLLIENPDWVSSDEVAAFIHSGKLMTFVFRFDSGILSHDTATPYFGSYLLSDDTLRAFYQTCAQLFAKWCNAKSKLESKWLSAAFDTTATFANLSSAVMRGCTVEAGLKLSPDVYVSGKLLQPVDLEADVITSLQNVMNSTFPITSTELISATSASFFDSFRDTCNEVLAIVQNTASPLSFCLLTRLLAEGHRHILWPQVAAALSTTVNRIPTERTAPLSVLATCCALCLLDVPTGDSATLARNKDVQFAPNYHVVRSLTDYVIVPLLRRLSDMSAKEFLISEQFFAVVIHTIQSFQVGGKPGEASFHDAENTRSGASSMLTYAVNILLEFSFGRAGGLQERMCVVAYFAASIVREMYDCCNPTVLADCCKHYQHRRVAPGKATEDQLHKDVLEACRFMSVRGAGTRTSYCLVPEESQKEHLCTRQAAFACLGACARRSARVPRDLFMCLTESADEQVYSNVVDTGNATVQANPEQVFWSGGMPRLDDAGFLHIWKAPEPLTTVSTAAPQPASFDVGSASLAPSTTLSSSSLMSSNTGGGGGNSNGGTEPARPADVIAYTYFSRGLQTVFRTLLSIIDTGFILFNTPASVDVATHAPPSVFAPTAMPEHMDRMLQKLKTSDSLSLKLLIFRVIASRPLLFRPWQNLFVPALLAFMQDLRLCTVQQIASKEVPLFPAETTFHVVLEDLCTLLTSAWVTETSPSGQQALAWTPATKADQQLAKRFLTYLVECAPSKIAALRNQHLSFIGPLIQRWCTGAFAARPSFKPIISFMTRADTATKASLSEDGARIAVALGTIAYLVAAGQPPILAEDFGPEVPGSIDKFYRALATLWLPSKQRPMLIYSRLAELIGLILAQARDDIEVEEKSKALKILWPEVQTSLRQLHMEVQNQSSASTQERGFDRFLVCLSLAAQNFPQLVTADFVTKAAQPLHLIRGRTTTRGRTLELVLRILISAVSADPALVDDVWLKLYPHTAYLLRAHASGKKRAYVIQYLMLQILQAMLEVKSPADLANMFDAKSPAYLPRIFANHPSIMCKRKYYDLLLTIWDKLSDGAGSSADDHVHASEQLQTEVGTAVFQGLHDPAAEIREAILTHFKGSSRLSAHPSERFVQICEDLCQPTFTFTSSWTNHAAMLLLDLTSKSPDYTSSSAIFSDGINIAGHTSDFTQLDIDTSWRTASFSLRKIANQYERQGGGGNILMTQAPVYSATQDDNAGLLISTFVPRMDAHTQRVAHSFASQAVGPAGGATTTEDAGKRSKSRLVALTELPSSNLSLSASEQPRYRFGKPETLLALHTQAKLQRKFGAKLTRSYRQGELPDIQLPISAFIKPLTVLCQSSDEVALLTVQALCSVLHTFPIPTARNKAAAARSHARSAAAATTLIPASLRKAASVAGGSDDEILVRAMISMMNTTHDVAVQTQTTSSVGLATTTRTLLRILRHEISRMPALASGEWFNTDFFHRLIELSTRTFALADAITLLEALHLANRPMAGLRDLPIIPKTAGTGEDPAALQLLSVIYRMMGFDMECEVLCGGNINSSITSDPASHSGARVGLKRSATRGKSSTAAITREDTIAEDAPDTLVAAVWKLQQTKRALCLQDWESVDALLDAAPDKWKTLTASEKAYAAFAHVRQAAVEYEPDEVENTLTDEDIAQIKAAHLPVLTDLLSNLSISQEKPEVSGDLMQTKLHTLFANASIILGDVSKARSFTEDGLVTLPALFASIPELSPHLRTWVLSELQPLAELRQFFLLTDRLQQIAVGKLSSDVAAAEVFTTMAAWSQKQLNCRNATTDTSLHSEMWSQSRRIIALQLARHPAWTSVQQRAQIMEARDDLLRCSDIGVFHSWLQLDELELAKASMLSCRNINLLRWNTASTMQMGLAMDLQLASAKMSQKRLAYAEALSKSAKCITVMQGALEKCRDVKILHRLQSAFSREIAEGVAAGFDSSEMNEYCVTQYIADLEAMLGEATVNAASIAIQVNSVDPATASDKAVCDHAVAAVSAIQPAAEGCIRTKAPGITKDAASFVGPKVLQVLCPDRAYLAQQSHAALLLMRFMDGVVRMLQERQSVGIKLSKELTDMTAKLGGLEEMAAVVVRCVMQVLKAGARGNAFSAAAGGGVTSLSSDLSKRRGGGGSEMFDHLPNARYTPAARTSVVREASMYIPRVLALAREYAAACNEFLTAVPQSPDAPTSAAHIPLYAFLPWIPQLLASVRLAAAEGGTFGKGMSNLAACVAKTYPQAVYYPLRVAAGDVSSRDESAWMGLDKYCRSKLMDSFIAALDELQGPDKQLRAYLGDLLDSPRAMDKVLDAAESKKVVSEIRTIIAEFEPGSRGKAAHSWISDTSKYIFDRLIGRISRETLHDIATWLRSKNMTTVASSDLSAWLARYVPDVAAHIEIPGQYDKYDGSVEPLPHLHARLTGLHPIVQRMASLMSPLVIDLFGDDQRVYKFLLKAGDDLRTDQRIQQLFFTTNRFWRAQGRPENSLIRTYAVIPILPRVGLIEFVPNTMSFKAAMSETLGKGGTFAKGNDYITDALKAHGGTPATIYAKCYLRNTAEEMNKLWLEGVARNTPALLRTLLQKHANSADALILLRSNLVESLTSFSALCYLIGLGDRHMDNYMLSVRDMCVVPIDFGAAFGYATVRLPVPELIPFRMTPQIFQVVQPIPALPLFTKKLTVALKSLQSPQLRAALITLLETYILDPTVDWASAATKRSKGAGAIEDASSSFTARDVGTEYSKARVLLMQLKLDGLHPATYFQLLVLQNPNFTKQRNIKRGSEDESILRTVMSVILGDATAQRRSPDNAQPFQLPQTHQALLETLVGGPLTGNSAKGGSSALDVSLMQCADENALASSLLDMCIDTNLVSRMYWGLSLTS